MRCFLLLRGITSLFNYGGALILHLTELFRGGGLMGVDFVQTWRRILFDLDLDFLGAYNTSDCGSILSK